MVTRATTPIGEEEIREELGRIVASADFLASDRNRQFLQYLVEESLADRGERIKAYSIATSVFGRSDDFDPLQDSIVRIEAARLRRAIERFYLLDIGHPSLRISIPKGFSTAFACLSLLYSNAARYSPVFYPTRVAPLHRAYDLAREAIRLGPSSSRAYHARAVAEWFLGRPDAGIATLRIAGPPRLAEDLAFRQLHPALIDAILQGGRADRLH